MNDGFLAHLVWLLVVMLCWYDDGNDDELNYDAYDKHICQCQGPLWVQWSDRHRHQERNGVQLAFLCNFVTWRYWTWSHGKLWGLDIILSLLRNMLIICMMFCANKQESFSFATNGLDVKAQNPISPMLVSVERWWGKMENMPSSRVMKWRADNRQSWCCQRSCEHNIAAQFQNTFSISTHQTIDKHLFWVAKICSTWYLYSFYSALIIEISASNDNLFR